MTNEMTETPPSTGGLSLDLPTGWFDLFVPGLPSLDLPDALRRPYGAMRTIYTPPEVGEGSGVS